MGQKFKLLEELATLAAISLSHFLISALVLFLSLRESALLYVKLWRIGIRLNIIRSCENRTLIVV